MLQKYKKLGLAAAACTLLGMAASEAAVTLTFAQSGGDVVATWSGSYTLPAANGSAFDLILASMDTDAMYSIGAIGNFDVAVGHGVPSFPVPSEKVGSYVGDTFGFAGSAVGFPTGATGVYSPTGTMTFAGETLASLGVASFNNHLAFQGSNNVAGSQQIFVTTAGAPSAVPEPAGAATALVCCVSGLLIRTRQRRRI